MEFTFILLIVQCLQFLQPSHAGSTISLQATPTGVVAGLTDCLTFRCTLNKTAASAIIVGRRDVTSSIDNMAEVTSIVLMKDGSDVAAVSHIHPPHVMDGSANSKVAGMVGQDGFLELNIQNPTKQQMGEFVCEINAVSQSGHIVTFTASQEVAMTTPTTADLVTYAVQLNREKNELNQKYNDLKAKVDTQVFFSAGSTKPFSTYSDTYVAVFDRVFSNVGGAYNNISGEFVCEVAGYYDFEFNMLSSYAHRHTAILQLNNQNVVATYGRTGSGNEHGGSNNAIIKVAKGDVVRISLVHSSSLTSSSDKVYTTFSGKLVALM